MDWGIPTILLRPITTALFPRISKSVLSSIRITPAGVQGSNPLTSPWTSLPRFCAWNPSTSLFGSIRSVIETSSIPEGRGDWTRTPLILGSSLSDLTVVATSSYSASEATSTRTLRIPSRAHARSLAPT